MMIKTTSGRHINLDHVREYDLLHRKSDKTHHIHFEYADGTPVQQEIPFSEYERLATGGGTIIPATPGWTFLRWGRDDGTGSEWVTREDIVAWELDPEFGFHRVFTAWSSPEDFTRNEAVLCPNGNVVYPGSQVWDNEERWLKELRARPTEEEEAKHG